MRYSPARVGPRMKEILLVGGARPNFMKLAPVHRALRQDARLRPRLVHTGQHYDAALSSEVMADLGLPEPDHHLGAGSGSASIQTARILEAFEDIARTASPAAVVVVGDVTSTLAAALAASNLDLPIAHVESGLRSFDWRMPEERNRVLVDRLARWLFVSEPSGMANLAAEGVKAGAHLVGNTMIDSLLEIIPRARALNVRERLGLAGRYSVMTLHRPGNVDDPGRLRALLEALAPIASQAPLVFPVHPRTRSKLERVQLPAGLRCLDPMTYVDFLGLVADASLVLTDSGGLQEETTVLGVPCITLRPNTERPITLEIGTNELVDGDPEKIRTLGARALAGEWKAGRVPEGWDGHAAERLVKILADDLS